MQDVLYLAIDADETGRDQTVMLVMRPFPDGHMETVNELTDKEAIDLYNQVTGRKVEK